LDATPLFYFFSSPKDALASAGTGMMVGGIGMMMVGAIVCYMIFRLVLMRGKTLPVHKARLKTTMMLVLAEGLLFIPIRGGFSVSTMNIGKVYYSDNIKLNHAAINPCFSLMESVLRGSNFEKQYRFMDDNEAEELFDALRDKPETDSIPALFTRERPNIVFVILESFLSKAMETVGGLPDVAVHLDELAGEGILFTRFHANSFRTDRGLVSILSGYPAQPTASIMKYPKKTQSLPSIPHSLKAAGYDLHYYYGGDADFTNMRSYLISTGITKIVSDKDFPLNERLSKWGAHDHVVFTRFLSDLENQKQQEPFLKIVQTSSSHEPFEVPFHKLSHPFLNSIAYTDSCLGDFIAQYKQTQWWNNSIIVLVPDHAGGYPSDIDNLLPVRYQIPLLIVGGAVKAPVRIDSYASQIDIAATLLAQLKLPHEEFTFSKNIVNPSSPHFAYFTYPNAFGMLTLENQLVFDCDADRIYSDTGSQPGENLRKGKAFLQKLYDDLGKR
jgi:phosphoglycerol transferase MdoB-like AlkP superfamily enzyme